MFTAEPKQNNRQTREKNLFLNHEREWLKNSNQETRSQTTGENVVKWQPREFRQRNKNKQKKKGMSTENNIGVQTRAMAQWVDNESNPEQGQRAMDQATTPTVELHRTKEDTIKEFV